MNNIFGGIMFTEDEKNRLIEYIDFMNEFDDDPSFREHALSAREKLVNLSSKKTIHNIEYKQSCENCFYKPISRNHS